MTRVYFCAYLPCFSRFCSRSSSVNAGSSGATASASSLDFFLDLVSFLGLAADASLGVLVVNLSLVLGVFAGCQRVSDCKAMGSHDSYLVVLAVALLILLPLLGCFPLLS